MREGSKADPDQVYGNAVEIARSPLRRDLADKSEDGNVREHLISVQICLNLVVSDY
jgi:hypothetical protein